MKYLMLISVITIILSSCSNGQNDKMTTNEIWEKHLITVFGEKSPKIESRCYKTKIKNKGVVINTTWKIKYPDKVYQKVVATNGTNIVYILNGNNGKIIYPDEEVLMTSLEVELFKIEGLIFPALYYKDIKLNGIEKIENEDCYVVEANSYPFKIVLYINTKTFLTTKTIVANSTLTVLGRKKVDGVILLDSYIIVTHGDTAFGKYLENNINCEIPDETFKLE